MFLIENVFRLLMDFELIGLIGIDGGLNVINNLLLYDDTVEIELSGVVEKVPCCLLCVQSAKNH